MLRHLVRLSCVVLFLSSALAQAKLPDFTGLIEETSPAVVKIEAEGRQASREELEQMEMLRRFFGQRGIPRQRQRRSLGSGFVVSADGYILTNNHVIEQADRITVRFSDREEYQAEIVGTDPSTDLALLKIAADNLTTLKFGDSESLKVGEWVVAIGSPFGLDYSASVGIVSAIGRSIPTEQREDFVPFIQTDVAINPGNSGGPLFNLDGEVVGVNSQIYTRSGGSNGISFAIPTHVAQRVITQLKEDGEVSRGWFGIVMQPVTKEKAEAFELKKPRGALVSDVLVDSPADKSGIEPGDVIVAIGRKPVDTISDLSHIVSNTLPGEKVAVALIREGKRKTLDVTVGSSNENQVIAAAGGGDKLGLVVEDLDKRTRARYSLRGGVVIKSIVPDSPAAGTDLQPGDIIDRIGRYRINDISDYEKLLERIAEGRPVPLRVIRDGQPGYITLTLK